MESLLLVLRRSTTFRFGRTCQRSGSLQKRMKFHSSRNEDSFYQYSTGWISKNLNSRCQVLFSISVSDVIYNFYYIPVDLVSPELLGHPEMQLHLCDIWGNSGCRRRTNYPNRKSASASVTQHFLPQHQHISWLESGQWWNTQPGRVLKTIYKKLDKNGYMYVDGVCKTRNKDIYIT